MSSEENEKTGTSAGEESEKKEIEAKPENYPEEKIESAGVQPEKKPEEKKETKPDEKPIKTPDMVKTDNTANDDEYVIPFMVLEEQKKAASLTQEMSDEEFRKYYEKYYNKKSFSDVVWHDRRKSTRIVVILLLVILLAIGGAAFYINGKLNTVTQKDPPVITSVPDEQVIYDEEELHMMNAINSAESLKDYLYQWANNGGELMSSQNVINVLLLGLDSEDALENGGRSDVIMLLSLNKKTQKINIASIYRDTWLYMNVDGNDRYMKFNDSYFRGGPEGTIKTFEENFKIKIDFYVTVDFSSFTDIINALGGLTLEVEKYEAEYINRTTVHQIEYGPEVTLDGWEALVYARIRHCDVDSDVSRTRRQRKVITTLLSELKNASYTEMYKAVTSLFGYVKTNLTKTQIISYMAQALRYGWMDYEITQVEFNDGEVFGTGYVGDYSTVFMDMPMVAYRLQEAVFGTTNIELSEDRATIFDTVNADRAPMPETTQATTEEETTQTTTGVTGTDVP